MDILIFGVACLAFASIYSPGSFSLFLYSDVEFGHIKGSLEKQQMKEY